MELFALNAYWASRSPLAELIYTVVDTLYPCRKYVLPPVMFYRYKSKIEAKCEMPYLGWSFLYHDDHNLFKTRANSYLSYISS